MKVLLVSQGESFGGIEKMEYEYYNHLKDIIDFSFIVPNNNVFNIDNVYSYNLNLKKYKNRIKYCKEIKRIINKNKFDIVHINSSSFFFSFMISTIAKKNNIKVIAHSHNIVKLSLIKKIIRYLLNPIYVKKVDKFLSCSKEAISSLLIPKYNDKAEILYNGIDIEKYRFDEKERKKIREKYNIVDKKVYGNVSRICYQKNHKYLISLFSEISKIEKNAFLVLVGDGPLKENCVNQVKELKLEDKVLFLGFRDDVDKILNACDVFILSSRYEGFGISLMEAKINGLVTYSSDVIPKNIDSNRFDLKDDIKEVANMIVNNNIDINRKDEYKKYLNSNYDIKNVCSKLNKIYLEKE